METPVQTNFEMLAKLVGETRLELQNDPKICQTGPGYTLLDVVGLMSIVESNDLWPDEDFREGCLHTAAVFAQAVRSLFYPGGVLSTEEILDRLGFEEDSDELIVPIAAMIGMGPAMGAPEGEALH